MPRDRFIEFHQGTVTFIDPQTSQEQTVPAASYEEVTEFTRRHRGWKLRTGTLARTASGWILDEGQAAAPTASLRMNGEVAWRL